MILGQVVDKAVFGKVGIAALRTESMDVPDRGPADGPWAEPLRNEGGLDRQQLAEGPLDRER